MGQQQSNAFNCGIFEKDTKGEIKGDQVMKVRQLLEQQKNKYQIPTRDTDKEKTSGNIKQIAEIAGFHNLKIFESKQKILTEIQHQNILKFSNHMFEGGIPKDNGFYEKAETTLAQVVSSRYNTQSHFPEQQVLKLIECGIYALAFLQKKNIKHHDIYPTNVFYVNGIFKLAHPLFVKSSYDLTFQRQRFSYLSPELIMALREEKSNINEQIMFKSDIFSFGMIMLEFCSLKPSSECYDEENYDIVDSIIKQRLQYIQEIYNPRIAEGIKLMLQYEVDSRIGCLEFARYAHQNIGEYLIANQQNSIKKNPNQIVMNGNQIVQQQFLQQQQGFQPQVMTNPNQIVMGGNFSNPQFVNAQLQGQRIQVPSQISQLPPMQQISQIPPQMQQIHQIQQPNQFPPQFQGNFKQPNLIVQRNSTNQRFIQQQVPQNLGYAYLNSKMPGINPNELLQNPYLIQNKHKQIEDYLMKPQRDIQPQRKQEQLIVTNQSSEIGLKSEQRKRQGQESLDERVKRILQKSKQMR